MRQATRDWLAAQEAIASRKDREERWNRPNQYNRYERHLAASQQKRLDDLAAERELEKQRLVNAGQFNVEDLRQTGATTRTGMTEGGATQRLGMTEGGLTQRFGTEQENRFKYLAQQQAGDQRMEELRNLNQLDLLDARGKQELGMLEKEFDLRSQEPIYKEFTTTDPLGGTSTIWQDVRALDRDLATIDELGGADGTFTNAPTRTDFDNQSVASYENRAAQAFDRPARTQPPLATLSDPGARERSAAPVERPSPFEDYYRYQTAKRRAEEQARIPSRVGPNYIPLPWMQ